MTTHMEALANEEVRREQRDAAYKRLLAATRAWLDLWIREGDDGEPEDLTGFENWPEVETELVAAIDDLDGEPTE